MDDYTQLSEIETHQKAEELWTLAVKENDDYIIIDESLLYVFMGAPYSLFPPDNIIPAIKVPINTLLLCLYKGKKVVMPIAQSDDGNNNNGR